MKSKRAAIAVVVVALWIGGMAMMVHRNASRTGSQQLAEVALRVQPSTLYYTIERDGTQIGAASSALDTTKNSLVAQEYFLGDYGSGTNPPERTAARWQTRLTRGLQLIDLNADVTRPTKPFSMNGTVQDDSAIFIAGNQATGRPAARYAFTAPLFNPSVASVVFMLGGETRIGRKQTMSVFDPVTRAVIRPTLRIQAESVFTVVDSAMRTTSGEWRVAHRDTVRAWRIEGVPHGLEAWVDAEGRIVTARAGSYSATRTAFEIAFRKTKTK